MTIPCDPGLAERLRRETPSRGPVTGEGGGGGFSYRFDPSFPGIVTAIHAGHRVREELRPLMEITGEQRFREEDPATDEMIRDCPSTVRGLDSRAEYDLNRPPEKAVPLTAERFWGVAVYKEPLPEAMIRLSLEKHAAFYLFLGTCLTVLLERFGACVVYDIHSYNLNRQVREKKIEDPPVFNLGTAALDRGKWSRPIDQWLERLGGIDLPGIPVTVAENKVFGGGGELCRRLTGWDPRILVLPTEIAKVYMDEADGVIFPDVVKALGKGLERAVADHASRFLSGL